MPEAYSADFWLAILRSLDIGIAVHCVQSSGRKEVFRNAKARSFEELGSAAPCIKLAEKEITFSRENSGPDSPGGTSGCADAERFVVEVTCNPLENGAVKAVIDAIPELVYLAEPKTADVKLVNKYWSESKAVKDGIVPHGEAASSSSSWNWWLSMLHPDDREAAMEAWRTSVATGKPFQHEFRMLKDPAGDPKDVVWMRGRAGQILNMHGQPFLVAGLTIDQTEEVTNRRLLAQEKSFLSTALDAVPVGVLVAKRETTPSGVAAVDMGTVVVSNQEMARIWRADALPPSNVGGYNEHVAYKHDGTRVEPHEWPLVRSCMTGERVVDEDMVIQRFDGTRGICRVSSAPVRDPITGDIIGSVAAGVDVTERVRAENEKMARLAAEEAAAQMKRLVANVSHEVRTPIAGVIGLVSLLEQSNLDDEQRELVDGIKDSGQLLLSVVNDLLDHSKIEEGKMELEKAPFSLKALLRHITLLSAEVTGKKNIRLETHLDPLLPAAVIQSDLRLKQVLLNLLHNAAKFTPPGGTISIEVRAEPCSPPHSSEATVTSDADAYGVTASAVSTAAGNALQDDAASDELTADTPLDSERVDGSDSLPYCVSADEKMSVRTAAYTTATAGATTASRGGAGGEGGSFVKLYFKVRDTGIGLSAEQMTRLFRRFMQADSSTTRRFGGSGLGLALCRELVKLMGGSISVESEGEGKGSCFSFHVVAEVCDIQAAKTCTRRRSRDVFGIPTTAGGSPDEPSTPTPTTPAVAASSPATDAPLQSQIARAPITGAPDRPASLGLVGRLSAMFKGKPSEHSPSKLSPLPSPVSPRGSPSNFYAPDTGYAPTTPRTALPPILASGSRLPPLQPLGLPPLDSAAPAVAATHQQTGAPRDRVACQQARILVVDDSSVNRQVLSKSLQRLGYTNVSTACDGAEAVAMVKDDTEGFDVVFCDLMMPGMGGADAAAAIKALSSPRRRSVPVVLVSALADATRHEGLFFDRLPKPFDATELNQVMTKCLAFWDSSEALR